MISRFQYLTQDLPNLSHQELAQIACENGIRWVQLRVKNKSSDEWLNIAKEVKSICDKFQSKLIINDNVDICKLIDADGVHLGKRDLSITKARKILGNEKIIGGTANTKEDLLLLQREGVNYIGFGPYRFTETKKKLSNILGIVGYTTIQQYSNLAVPVIAIGGIQPEDVPVLMNTGIYGIAVSSSINLSKNKPQTILNFLSQFSTADTFHNLR